MVFHGPPWHVREERKVLERRTLWQLCTFEIRKKRIFTSHLRIHHSGNGQMSLAQCETAFQPSNQSHRNTGHEQRSPTKTPHWHNDTWVFFFLPSFRWHAKLKRSTNEKPKKKDINASDGNWIDEHGLFSNKIFSLFSSSTINKSSSIIRASESSESFQLRRNPNKLNLVSQFVPQSK